MKRYRPYYLDLRTLNAFDSTMRENREGDYVLYADHLAEVQRYREALEKVRNSTIPHALRFDIDALLAEPKGTQP